LTAIDEPAEHVHGDAHRRQALHALPVVSQDPL